MRYEGVRRHSDEKIRWLDDRLPGLSRVHELGLTFDLILLSAVWQHIAPNDRQRAFRKMTALLKPGGLMLMTLRQGPAPHDRPMHPVTLTEVEALAADIFAIASSGQSERFVLLLMVQSLSFRCDIAGVVPF